VIVAAWLHHRFVQIHPFADGNGRVARALTVLVMQRHQLAPLVIDRFHRAGYLDALDRANDDDLRPLIELFINLESAALVSELEAADTHLAGTSSQVAHTLAAQLAARRAHAEQQLRDALVSRATAVLAHIRHWLTAKRAELEELFAAQGIRDARVQVEVSDSEHPMPARPNESPKHEWFRRQVIQSAQRAGHFAYFGGFLALARLKLVVEGVQLDFLISLHGAGERSNVMAVTTGAALRSVSSEDSVRQDVPIDTPSDAFRFVHSESIVALNDRREELIQLLDEGLSVALAELARFL
jgi:hypothetical protein